MATLARRIAAHCIGIRSNRVFIQIGINDYIHRVALGQTSAQFGTRVGLLLDQMRLILPLADVIVGSPMLMQSDGATDWRTAMATACSTRLWARYVNGSVQTPVTAWGDGLHPTSAQYAIIYECIESILGFWAWGNLPAQSLRFYRTTAETKLAITAYCKRMIAGPNNPFCNRLQPGNPHSNRPQLIEQMTARQIALILKHYLQVPKVPCRRLRHKKYVARLPCCSDLMVREVHSKRQFPD